MRLDYLLITIIFIIAVLALLFGIFITHPNSEISQTITSSDDAIKLTTQKIIADKYQLETDREELNRLLRDNYQPSNHNYCPPSNLCDATTRESGTCQGEITSQYQTCHFVCNATR